MTTEPPSGTRLDLAAFPQHPQRIAFLGTPAAAAPALQALVGAQNDTGAQVVVAVTNPDRRQGRGRQPQACPVKQAALAHDIAVIHDLSELMDYAPDLGVVVAFGQLIKPDLLAQLPFCNLHFSLLPRWRGAAPVEHAILAGDTQTGVCLMALEAELDTGPVFAAAETEIASGETAAELAERLAQLGAELLVRTLQEGLGEPAPQQGEPTWAGKLTTSDRELRWERPSMELERLVRIGQAWTMLGSKRLLIHQATAHDSSSEAAPAPVPATQLKPGELLLPATKGAAQPVLVGAGEHSWLELVAVQPEGRKVMAVTDWLRGLKPTGEVMLG